MTQYHTMNRRGLWALVGELRKTVNAEIASKLNYELQHGGTKHSTVLQAYASEVEESFQRAMDNGDTPNHEICQFETKSKHPVLLTLDPDWFDSQECE